MLVGCRIMKHHETSQKISEQSTIFFKSSNFCGQFFIWRWFLKVGSPGDQPPRKIREALMALLALLIGFKAERITWILWVAGAASKQPKKSGPKNAMLRVIYPESENTFRIFGLIFDDVFGDFFNAGMKKGGNVGWFENTQSCFCYFLWGKDKW